MSIMPYLANSAWMAGNWPAARAFARALENPHAAQGAMLRRYLRASGTFGHAHGFREDWNGAEFQRRVPLSRHEDYAGHIARIAAGEQAVLTRERVDRFAMTSGSSGAAKLIPHTRGLLREFAHAIAPWVVNLFQTHPAARRGPAYWSVTPVGEPSCTIASAIPVGFDDDTAYVSGIFRHLVDAAMAVPAAVRGIEEMETFRYITLLCLLRARELRLISVWHPSFLTLLVQSAAGFWDRALADIAAGTLRPPGMLPPLVARGVMRSMRPDPRRAAELRAAGPHEFAAWWPRLAVVSSWADAAARAPANELSRFFPHATIQGKGLLSTEAFVSFPYAAGGATHYPLAIRSHFFEFLADDGRVVLAADAEVGGDYAVVITTSGGFYRYQTGDRVRVTGRLRNTPCIEFLGRGDMVVDRFGEKLNAAFVETILTELRTLIGQPAFMMLAPDGNGYTLFIESAFPSLSEVPGRLDEMLARNPQYAYCRRLGQLSSARVFQILGDATAIYLETCRQRGQRLGDIKPAALHRDDRWAAVVPGRYIESA